MYNAERMVTGGERIALKFINCWCVSLLPAALDHRRMSKDSAHYVIPRDRARLGLLVTALGLLDFAL
jgi:hypothetical protein